MKELVLFCCLLFADISFTQSQTLHLTEKRNIVFSDRLEVSDGELLNVQDLYPGGIHPEENKETNDAVLYYKKIAYRLAKLKMYPLALKYYYESILAAQGRKKTAPLIHQAEVDWEKHTHKDSLNYLMVTQNGKNKNRRIRLYFKEIKEKFEDGKQAVAYAILIHVKQPVPGSRSSYTHINNVGHTFITLLKYNDDKTTVSNTFGFYPLKDHILSATPVFPGSSAAFINDNEHDWDEMVGRFIDHDQFDMILKIVKKYSRRRYNLNRNNCSDFGLCVADLAGISIKDTKGSWPLGHGNTPASIGQSILEGRLSLADSVNVPFLFICNNTLEE